MREFYADPKSPYYRPDFEADRRVVFFCGSGGLGALATDALPQLGDSRAARLYGGLKAPLRGEHAEAMQSRRRSLVWS